MTREELAHRIMALQRLERADTLDNSERWELSQLRKLWDLPEYGAP